MMDEPWAKLASHGISAEELRARIERRNEDAMEKLAEDLLRDNDIPVEVIGEVLRRVRVMANERMARDIPLMLESMRLTAPAANDDPIR